MINPIKIVIHKLKPINLIIYGFPKYFSVLFEKTFIEHTSIITKLLSRSLFGRKFILKTVAYTRQILRILHTVKFKDKNTVVFRSKKRLAVNRKYVFSQSAIIFSKVRLPLGVLLSYSAKFMNECKTRLKLRFKTLTFPTKMKVNFKSSLMILFRNFEKETNTWEQIIENDDLNTVEEFLWRII